MYIYACIGWWVPPSVYIAIRFCFSLNWDFCLLVIPCECLRTKEKNYDYKLDVHSFERKQSFHNSIIYSNQILKRKEKKVKNTTIWKCETRICTKTHGNTTAQPICILFIDIIIDFNSIHTICSWFGYGFIWFAFELKQNTHFCVWWLRAITTTTTEREKRRRDEYCNENEKKMSTVIEKLARYAAEFRPFTFYSAYFLCW